jgi:Polyketide cyclase / dehydrase and lipid transport
MATVRKEITTKASPDQAWKAIRDVGALHTRLVPGFVTGTRLEGNVRVVTFGNGMVATEPIVSIEEENRRLVWTSIGGKLSHYNSSVQVFGDEGGSRIVWTADLLPDELEGFVRSMIEQGSGVMKKTLDATAA